jgi:hypothetical protein
MNTTAVRLARYAGAGISGIAVSWVLAAPAIAMLPPDPDPGTVSPRDQKLAEYWDGHTGSPATATGTDTSSTSGGVDWSNLATALGGGAVLVGAVAVGATQLRRRQARPA